MTAARETIAAVAPRLRRGEASPVALVERCLAAIESRPEVNAFITVLRDSALAEARRAEGELRDGGWRGPLHGIPVAIKDLIDVAGCRTTSGSALPSQEAAADAPVIARLREAGAVILGKTNLHEFAFGTTSEESAFGPVRHPRDASYSAGGSSGGSAAALVTGMALGALGTDTGGSIRIPAAVCGTVGLKPGYDELSCDGIVPLSTTLDHVGPLALTVEDAALLYDALRGGPPTDLTSPPTVRLGVPRAYFFDLLDDGVRDAVEQAERQLRESGCETVDVTIDHASWTAAVYLHISLPEASWYHAPLLEHHASSYSPGVRLRLEMGRTVLAEDYVRAMKMRGVLRARVDRALDGCDALLLPALSIPAPRLGASMVRVGDGEQPVRAMMLRLTQLFNITGHPAVALPAPPAPDGWPRSIQLIGRHGATPQLLALAALVERQISGGPGSVGGGTG